MSAPQKRKSFTPAEDQAIWEFAEAHKHDKLGGNAVWQLAQQLGVTSHSWQAMRSRYLSFTTGPAAKRPKQKTPSPSPSQSYTPSIAAIFRPITSTRTTPSTSTCTIATPSTSIRTTSTSSLSPSTSTATFSPSSPLSSPPIPIHTSTPESAPTATSTSTDALFSTSTSSTSSTPRPTSPEVLPNWSLGFDFLLDVIQSSTSTGTTPFRSASTPTSTQAPSTTHSHHTTTPRHIHTSTQTPTSTATHFTQTPILPYIVTPTGIRLKDFADVSTQTDSPYIHRRSRSL